MPRRFSRTSVCPNRVSTASSAPATSCWATSRSSPSARTNAVRGRSRAERRHSSPPEKSTATSRADSSARKSWPTMRSSLADRWQRAATTAKSASKARTTSFRMATSSTSVSRHDVESQRPSVTAPRTLVIVPTYNERDNLPKVVEGLMGLEQVSLLIVDDGSPDGTGAVADDLARMHTGRVHVMHRTGRRGLGRSYIDGIRWAIDRPYDGICQMDADLSHDPARVPALVDALATADVVVGSRYV